VIRKRHKRRKIGPYEEVVITTEATVLDTRESHPLATSTANVAGSF
jgi:hypothetical protein